jgi:pepF/M3 family oligoendopeptidase
MSTLPRWDLSVIYPTLDSADYQEDLAGLTRLKEEILSLCRSRPRQANEEPQWLKHYIRLYNQFHDLFDTLYAYAYLHFSVTTTDYAAVNSMNRLDEIRIPVKSSLIDFRNITAGLQTSVAECLQAEPELKEYSFFIEEQLFLRSRQMTLDEEELAMDLLRTGGELWGRLQEAVSSTLKAPWDKRTGNTKTVTELRSLASDPKRATRKKAFLLECDLWESMKIPLAFSINGVKGFTVILDKKRHFKDTIERSLLQARISRPVLDSLIETMKESLPDFRRYFKAKANILGIPSLAFFDIFAPLREKSKKWSFNEAGNFIVEQFGRFSDELADFTREALDASWIDPEPKAGKVGGAYCISLPLKKESRILCNFNESFSGVTTIAHELGHAFHHHVLAGASSIHRDYPMTLAETASIFSENIVFEGALITFPKSLKTDALEHFLQDTAQVIVDIYSRYLFESRLFAARRTGEISAEELCAMMAGAQEETYGDALDKKYRHPYMWAVKGHYYRPELPFYNYPYAFGLLFGLGLFARYREEGCRFADTYKSILRKTGRMTCVDLTRELGFDIESKGFWESGLSLIRSRIDEFEKIAAAGDGKTPPPRSRKKTKGGRNGNRH